MSPHNPWPTAQKSAAQAWRQAWEARSPREQILLRAAAFLVAFVVVWQWAYQTGQLRLQDFKPSASQQQSLQQSLSTQGYQWRAEGDAWLLQVNTPAEAKP